MNLSVTYPARKYRLYFLLICGTMLYFFANVQRVAIPGTVFDLLQAKFNVSAPSVTALGAVFMYVYAFVQLFAGLLVDRYGGIRTILLGGVLFCTGSLLFPLADSLPMMIAARALTGVGAGTLYLSLIQETIRAFPGNYTVMISLVIMTGYAGGILANAPFAAGVVRFGLTPLLIGIAAASFLFYLCFALTGSTLKFPKVQDVPLRFRPFWEVLKVRHNRELFLFSGVNWGIYYVIQTVIGKKFLEDFCSISSSRAAWILSLMGMISAISGFLFALFSRLSGNRRRIFCRIAGCVALAAFPAITLMILLDLRNPVPAVFLCLLATTASMSSITIPLLKETNQKTLTGASIAFMNFSFYLAVAVFGNAVGYLLEVFPPEAHNGILVYPRQSYLLVFSVLSLFAGVVAFYSFRMKETFGKQISVS